MKEGRSECAAIPPLQADVIGTVADYCRQPPPATACSFHKPPGSNQPNRGKCHGHARTVVKQRQDRRWKAKECLADSSNGGHYRTETQLTALPRQVAPKSSPQSAENELHQKFALSGVDQDAALSYLWKNDRCDRSPGRT